jgi:hypothetical protein
MEGGTVEFGPAITMLDEHYAGVLKLFIGTVLADQYDTSADAPCSHSANTRVAPGPLAFEGINFARETFGLERLPGSSSENLPEGFGYCVPRLSSVIRVARPLRRHPWELINFNEESSTVGFAHLEEATLPHDGFVATST